MKIAFFWVEMSEVRREPEASQEYIASIFGLEK
jgi:hypothetical protein